MSRDGHFVARAEGEWLLVQPRCGREMRARCPRLLLGVTWGDYGCLWTLDEAVVTCRRVADDEIGEPFLEFSASGISWIEGVLQGLLLWSEGVLSLRNGAGFTRIVAGDLRIGRPLRANAGGSLALVGTAGAWGISFGTRRVSFPVCAVGNLGADLMILFSPLGMAATLDCCSGETRRLRWRFRT